MSSVINIYIYIYNNQTYLYKLSNNAMEYIYHQRNMPAVTLLLNLTYLLGLL